MAKKIKLTAGHGGTDSGAVGILGRKEHDENTRIVKAIVNYLKDNSNAGNNISWEDEKTSNGNFKSSYGTDNDYFISFHFNAFDGSAKGTEVLYGSTYGSSVAEKMLAGTKKHFYNRGLKLRNDLYVIGLGFDCLVETCFIDSSSDVSTYDDEFNKLVENMAKEIAKIGGYTMKAESKWTYYAEVKHDLRGARFDQNNKEWYLMKIVRHPAVFTDFDATDEDTADNFKPGNLQTSYYAGTNKKGWKMHGFISGNGRTYYYAYKLPA